MTARSTSWPRLRRPAARSRTTRSAPPRWSVVTASTMRRDEDQPTSSECTRTKRARRSDEGFGIWWRADHRDGARSRFGSAAIPLFSRHEDDLEDLDRGRGTARVHEGLGALRFERYDVGDLDVFDDAGVAHARSRGC